MPMPIYTNDIQTYRQTLNHMHTEFLSILSYFSQKNNKASSPTDSPPQYSPSMSNKNGEDDSKLILEETICTFCKNLQYLLNCVLKEKYCSKIVYSLILETFQQSFKI